MCCLKAPHWHRAYGRCLSLELPEDLHFLRDLPVADEGRIRFKSIKAQRAVEALILQILADQANIIDRKKTD